MNIELDHPFKLNCHNLKELVECRNLSSYKNKLSKQSLLYPNRYEPDKYCGDGFEYLVEAIIKLSPMDNRIGIGEYKVIITGDTGVDGCGIGINLKPATVQCKFRIDSTKLLTTDDKLSNFIAASQNKYGVDINDIDNMLVVTTAKDIHYFTKNEMLYKKVRCVGDKQLRTLIDNNFLFWENFKLLSENI